MKLIQLLLVFISFAFSSCGKKPDAVLTPQQEAEYRRMMNNAPKKTYEQLQEENAKLKYEAEQRALDK